MPSAAAPGSVPAGARMLELIRRLYPICRSITGDGVRDTLRILAERLPLEVQEVPSGSRVLDWTIPPEWNVRDAWIADARGERVVDFRRSNLHLVGYSTPLRQRVALPELRRHLHSLPEHPDWIPYRTSYYERSWGFCVSQRQLEALSEPEYDVCIDARLAPGHLTYGELLLPGSLEQEVLISAHVCHPSLANDNLSGIAVAALLAEWLGERTRRYSYRFLFVPGTIGSLTWLARNRGGLARIRHGLTLVCLGDASPLTYKRTVAGDAEIDRAAGHVMAGLGGQTIDFSPWGYDERQYNAPGFRLPVGSLMRGRHGRFPEYHTSADDLSFVSARALEESLEAVRLVLEVLEEDATCVNLAPHGEPQLGRRGLYRALGGAGNPAELELAMLWVLNLSDGSRSLLDVAERAQLSFRVIRAAADLLARHGLLEERLAG